ncbi:hypothetical protein NITUZ_60178 [Candidatus Nitrosotenuis uzonensis]|uniref:Uncharacterized protein n=1 Tax=Candidatus Nitrosotenuis uzonensis TaxID=1407055 RepID=V6AVN2_9ARCH|nr:hypothetical protein NITUZ_60178 [Candidatus Nitrosotenuis uzonensis]
MVQKHGKMVESRTNLGYRIYFEPELYDKKQHLEDLKQLDGLLDLRVMGWYPEHSTYVHS